jgi:type II secretory pathway component PulM
MTRLWARLSRRERALVITTCVILLALLVKYVVVIPVVQRREWVKTQLEIHPSLLEKNLRYMNRKEEFAAALQAARDEPTHNLRGAATRH